MRKEKKKKIEHDDLLEKLEKENTSLKKRVSQLRKLTQKATESENGSEEDFKEDSSRCPFCSGETKVLNLKSLSFLVCKSCKKRVKINHFKQRTA